MTTEGCGETGVPILGPLVRVGERERKRRTVKGLVGL